jgi:hypothetical protein
MGKLKDLEENLSQCHFLDSLGCNKPYVKLKRNLDFPICVEHIIILHSANFNISVSSVTAVET